MANDVKVYTVNGAVAGSSSSLPDWLTRKRAAAKGKGKRVIREHVEGTIELIQGFEFPEASNRIKTTRDGHHVIATGTYKPQIRVWDLDQLAIKFERHTDAENVDFVMLSDDWTKSIHLQNDRTIDLHTQGGFHYRTRIPRFGRSLAYHFPSCDAYFTASGNEIYRLNLGQGRFMTPLVLKNEDGSDDISGVNVVDINPAHQLLAFGIEANGTVQFWDPRSRSSVGTLRLPKNRLMQTGVGAAGLPPDLSVAAIASRADGLSYAIGTSTGHTLLYDIRSARPFATKDQGYGLPVKNVAWIDGGSRMAGDGMVISADKKVIKIWDRNSPSTNFASITPAHDLNDLHHVPDSGLLMTANEGIQMAAYYIPQLGPAPRWASFLENITEEMEDSTTRSVYEDYKFVERTELNALGLDHLIGTPTLKPYMHGYFISLKLYEAARLISNPFAYAEHRERMVQEKMDKLAETRIRAKKEAGVKVNKALAEKILREEERARKREEKKRQRKATEKGEADMEVDDEVEAEEKEKERSGLLSDPRFAKVFENPEFAIDENSREYALLNPSAVAQKRSGERAKTAVEDEEEESDQVSSDGLGDSESGDSDDEDDGGSDSSDAGELNKFDRRARPGQQNVRAQEAYNRNRSANRAPRVNLVPMRPQTDGTRGADKNATFGQRRMATSGSAGGKERASSSDVRFAADGGMEVSWTPASGPTDVDDMLVPGGGAPKGKTKRPGVESFGAGLERGGGEPAVEISESERKGRTKRRTGVRSGSKNVFRGMNG
ncbi:putative NUC153 domain containing protein [Lyophyllum shimeji]|uniref:NUC153 domain containing protein n=1 Tax=Lyophyllum shimeji TaxID=47721 RepID=A0A9P3PPS7_LYOSH|nr:putative NUC153 domain containing protein [Lyophyllum shimeji]